MTAPDRRCGAFLAHVLAGVVLAVVAGFALGTVPGVVSPAAAQTRGLEIVGQLGGTSGVSRAVAVAPPFAYVGKGPRLVVYDISDPARPVRIGVGPVLPGIVRHLAILGSGHVLAAAADSVFVVNVANPTAPQVKASFDVHLGAHGVAADDHHAYVTNGNALSVYDLVTPASPQLVATLSADRSHGIAVEGGFAYVAGWDKLHVIDVADPANPHEVASLAPQTDPFDDFLYVAARGNLVVLLGRDAHIIDVSNPHQPVEVGQFHPFQYPAAVQLRGDLVYLAISTLDYDTLSEYGGLEVVDISVPSAPAGRGMITVPDDVIGVAVDVGHAYLAANGEGLRVVDIADPDHLREVASDAPSLRTADSIVVMDDSAFVSSGNRLLAFDTRDTTRAQPVGEIRVDGRAPFDPIDAANGYLYVGAEKRLAVIDARDPGRMRQVTSVALDDHLPDLKVVGRQLHLAHKGNFRVFDVGDPAAPTEAGSVAVPENAVGVDIVDQTAYVSTYGIANNRAWQGGLVVLDVGQPDVPRRLGWLELTSPLSLSAFATDITERVPGALRVDPWATRRARRTRPRRGLLHYPDPVASVSECRLLGIRRDEARPLVRRLAARDSRARQVLTATWATATLVPR